MSEAPLELVMIGFPGSKFNGRIVPALQDLVDREIITIVDLVLVSKDDDGMPTIVEIETGDDDLAPLRDVVGDVNGLISEEDIVDLAAGLDPGDSAAIMLFEHTWASEFAAAVRAADGELAVTLRIPQEVVDEVLTAQAGG
jgi:hypothetical protein